MPAFILFSSSLGYSNFHNDYISQESEKPKQMYILVGYYYLPSTNNLRKFEILTKYQNLQTFTKYNKKNHLIFFSLFII